MAAVRVGRREDEDVEPVDVLLGRRVRGVVAQEPLGGLEARDVGDPLTGVLLAVEEDADRVVRAVLADPVHLLGERALLDVARVRADERPGRVGRRGEAAGPVDRAAAQVVRQLHLRAREGLRRRGVGRALRDRVGPARRRRDDARARVAAVGVRVDERARRRVGGDRRDHLRRRAGQRAGAVGGEIDHDVLGRDRDLADAVGGVRVGGVVGPPRAVGHRDRQREHSACPRQEP